MIRQHEGYCVPKAIEAVICMLMEYVETGTRLFGPTLIRTEIHSRYIVVVGYFNFSGLSIGHNSDTTWGYSVAAIRKFPGAGA